MRHFRSKSITLGASLLALFSASGASAHVTISSGPATAGAIEKIVFGVGHGCSGADTASVTIEMPPGVGSVRPIPSSALDGLAIERDDSDTVVSVTWERRTSAVLASDMAFYELAVQLRVPNQPFTTLFFPTHQTCLGPDGEPSTVHWVGVDDTPGVEPAPALFVMPARYPGWNRFTVPADVADLFAFFSDAVIVWRGEAAFSANPTLAELLRQTSGVESLETLSVGDVVWVRY
ncbi:MAG: YcnI family protein [Pseudomonadota bacterium]